MALLSKDEITMAWRALSDVDASAGWRSITVSHIGSVGLQAARFFPGNEEALLIGFPSIVLPHSSYLPQGRGFRVIPANPDDHSRSWVALIRQPHGSLDLFAMMATDVVSAMAASHLCKEDQLFQLFLGRIRAWQSFMEKENEGLRPEAELGLVGELTCLEGLFDAGVPCYSAVKSWVGPYDGLQDFELGLGAIEVKSTLAGTGFPATIQSLDQLDDSIRTPLFLCGCRYRISNDGVTLPERIQKLREMIEHDDAATMMFNSSLLQIGYLDAHAKRYCRQFVLVEVVYLLVDEKFPRLTIGNVPQGVRSVRYEIDLAQTGSKKYHLKNILNLIEGI